MPRYLAWLIRGALAYGLVSACSLETAHAQKPAAACAVGSAARLAAENEFAAIDAAVAALDVAADPQPLATRLVALAQTPCLKLLGDLDLAPSSGLSLKTYWAEGGSDHLQSYLHFGKPGAHHLWLAPAVRRALTLETNPESPIRELLCSSTDAACGGLARGWAVRAEHAFRALAARAQAGDAPAGSAHDDPANCERVALRAKKKHRFAQFRACQDGLRSDHAALPIGTTRSLDRGWLVVRGRRGHYAFCDETRAYDLATGSAYRAASCSGLALEAGGNVDFRSTDAARRVTAEMGHLPVDALRESAWMLLMLDEVDRRVVDSYGIALPSTIPLTDAENDFATSFPGMSAHWTSSDTELDWHVEVNGQTLKAGTLTWSPDPLDDSAEEHAATLLRVAEASLALDCPSAPPPTTVTAVESSANGLDADRKSLDTAANGLRESWRTLIERQRACAKRPWGAAHAAR